MDDTSEEAAHLVMVGAGHSQIEVLRSIAMHGIGGARATLISRDYHAPYSGMLPGLIAGHYTFEEAHINVGPLANRAGVRFIHDEVQRLDLDRRIVHCVRRPPISFDLLSINIGSRPSMKGIPGAAEFAVPAKPVDQFLEYWENLLERVRRSSEALRIVTVGGGAGGVELTLSMHHRLTQLRKDAGQDSSVLQFEILNAAETLLPTHNARARARIAKALELRNISVRNASAVHEVRERELQLDSGITVAFDELIWVTQAAPTAWIAESGIATDERGFIEIDETLRSTSHPFVFAAGDIASMTFAPRAKSGVFAVRQGPYLASNLRRALRQQPLEKYRPQRQFLSLISTGDRNAIASRGPFAFEGPWVWHWKDRIDRAFMTKYNEFGSRMEDMSMKDDMRCGGCGSKIGSDALSAALRRVNQTEGNGIVLGLDAPDDAAVVQLPAGTLAVQSVDFFRSFVDDPYLLGKIAAQHCLSDLYAMGATPHTALAIVTIPVEHASAGVDTLGDLLQGGVEVLGVAGATLVGGHTTEGTELVFGFSVNGYVAPEELLRKSGMRTGDKLVLTKPIGTGVLLASQMRGLARGRCIDGAFETMMQSNAKALNIFRHSGVTACTDVTGFGLLGHLEEMVRASACGARVLLNAVPLLEGAAGLSAEGVRSTLYPENIRHARVLDQPRETHPAYELLFDPQTSGGLLGSIPGDLAEQCVEELRNAGYIHAAIVGEVVEGPARIQLVV